MYSVIEPLLLPLRFVPDAVHSRLLVRAFNHLLRGQSIVQRLRELEGKTLCLAITDIDCRCQFLIQDGRLRSADSIPADVTIRGRLHDFILLATRREDPDTLFFSRRLCIEGDTETGVHFKNLLDAMEFDWSAHVNDVLGPRLGRRAMHIVHNNPLSQLFIRARPH